MERTTLSRASALTAGLFISLSATAVNADIETFPGLEGKWSCTPTVETLDRMTAQFGTDDFVYEPEFIWWPKLAWDENYKFTAVAVIAMTIDGNQITITQGGGAIPAKSTGDKLTVAGYKLILRGSEKTGTGPRCIFEWPEYKEKTCGWERLDRNDPRLGYDLMDTLASEYLSDMRYDAATATLKVAGMTCTNP